MMDLTLVAAIAENNAIGKDGKLPWDRIPGDLPRLKQMTIGHPIIVGRTTYDPLGPLPQRYNIVLTSRKIDPCPSNVYPVNSVEEALGRAAEFGDPDVFVLGGAKVYKEMMPFATKMEITHVRRIYDADTFFPNIDMDEWELTKKEDHETHYFATYARKM